MNLGNTPTDLQDALVSEISRLFGGDLFKDLGGGMKKLTVYTQDLPIPETFDDADIDVANVPYAIVRISQGEISESNAPAITKIIIVLCLWDDENRKQAHRDIIHIINVIQQRFLANPVISNFRFQFPFKWALQDDEDTFPHFFGAIEMYFEDSITPVVEDEFT